MRRESRRGYDYSHTMEPRGKRDDGKGKSGELIVACPVDEAAAIYGPDL